MMPNLDPGRTCFADPTILLPGTPRLTGKRPLDGGRTTTPAAASPRGHQLHAVHDAASTPVTTAPGQATALAEADGCTDLIGRSPQMLELHRRIRRVAATDATVLISGETGTGKELVARAVHRLSDRRKGAFVALNCGAVSAALIESELFGHERGSFTGANRRHHGVFSQADGGTLFLDEVTEMDLDLQVRLLRVLETGSFQRIGGEETVHADVRILAATNKDPLTAVRKGRLREDLYYRLQVVPLSLPALRDREGDIDLLAQHFLAELNDRYATHKVFTAVAMQRLRQHPWPGNVRELQHFVQQAYLMADHEIDASGLPAGNLPAPGNSHIAVAVGTSVAAAEQQLILATMSHCQGNKSSAAIVLGISLKTLYCRLNLYAAGAANG